MIQVQHFLGPQWALVCTVLCSINIYLLSTYIKASSMTTFFHKLFIMFPHYDRCINLLGETGGGGGQPAQLLAAIQGSVHLSCHLASDLQLLYLNTEKHKQQLSTSSMALQLAISKNKTWQKKKERKKGLR